MELIEQLNETCNNLGKAFEEFKSEYDRQLKGVTGNLKATIGAEVKDALAQAKLDKLSQTMDDLTGQRDDLVKRIKAEEQLREDLERKVNMLRVTRKPADDMEEKARVEFTGQVKSAAKQRGASLPQHFDVSIEEYRAYKSAFNAFLRKDSRVLTADEVKALSIGDDANGGFLVHADMTGRMVQRVYDLSPIRQIASVQQITGDALEGIEDNDEAAAGWVGETQTRAETNTPQVGKYRIPCAEMYAKPKASQNHLDDAAYDIEGWLSMKIGDKFARLEGNAFCVGDGVVKPRGFTTYTMVEANGTDQFANGTLYFVKSGASGAFHTTQADPLFDLIAQFKPWHLMNATWVTRRTIIAAIRKFKTTNTLEYIWQPGLQLGQPDRLLGYPITMAEDMPALAANSLSMALGNFKEGYQIVDRFGIRMLRDPYTDKPYVQFYTTKRTGGAVVNFQAIKFIKFIN